MSSSHAEIGLHSSQGTWYLKDLGSTNGTFVRVSSMALRHGQALIVGDGRYVFHWGPDDSAASTASPVNLTRTISWGVNAPDDGARSQPALVCMTNGAEGRRFPLNGNEHWLGRDPQRCSIVLEEPTVDPRHARLFQDRRGRWTIENHNSLNGVWARIEEIALGRGAYFQCGEQRFLFKIL